VRCKFIARIYFSAGANIRKPTSDEVIPYVDDYLEEILKDICSESRIPNQKLLLAQEMLNSKGSENWVNFLIAISSEIIQILTERGKVMPSNQYEETLSALNSKLNNQDFFEDLKLKMMFCVRDTFQNSPYLGMLVFRISFCLCEKIQLLVMSEMRNPVHTSKTVVSVEEVVSTLSSTVNSPEEKKAFEDHMSKLVRKYYCKVSQLVGPIWAARALCVRKEFVVSTADDFVTHKALIDAALWLQGTVSLSERALHFFCEVEQEIQKVFKETKQLSKERILENISTSQQPSLLNDWCVLTSGYFSEKDALTFMRDFISIVINLSVRLEEKRLFGLERESKNRLPQFSLRGNLKRN
jgi:hypothetical protein